MKWFQRKKRDSIIIVGCGRLGSTIASSLSDQELSVSVIDINPDSFRKLPPSYAGFTVTGDGSDTDILNCAGVKTADVVIATTDNDDINIVTSQIASEIFHVKQVIARIKDTSKTVVFTDTGIETICPAQLSATACMKLLAHRQNDKNGAAKEEAAP